jgi:hypothetical protein
VEDWPLLKDLLSKQNSKLKPWLESAAKIMSEGKAAEAADVLAKIVTALDKTKSGQIPPPSEEYVRTLDKLRTCVSNLGNIAFVPPMPEAKAKGTEKKNQ